MRLPSPDTLIVNFDRALRALAGGARASRRLPADVEPQAELTREERLGAAALMRVNHAGEVCAQALYQGQALGARDASTVRALEQAAREEEDHLAWSAQRIRELGGRPSALAPLWYAGSLAIGAASAALGDRWNLAFLAETERQVSDHLAGHIERLPEYDSRTRALIAAMRADEMRHRETAVSLGAPDMPAPVRLAMRLMAKVMTATSYRV